MQAVRHAARQVAQRGATQLKSVRGMASDASSEKAHFDEAMKEMSKWCVNVIELHYAPPATYTVEKLSQ